MCINQSAVHDLGSSEIRKHAKIGVLTYEAKHRKTFDTLCLLKAKGYKNVTVYSQLFTYQKQFEPYLKHRPLVIMDIPNTELLCKNLGYNYCKGNMESFFFQKGMLLLVCGAGIVPERIWRKYVVINAHPGYIPVARGLDAFKWAIWEGQPIGVTTHIIGQYIDAGEIIERRKIKITKNTTFYEAAQCVYENEVTMLVEAIEKLEGNHIFIEPGENIVHRRMPHDIEVKLLKRFEEYKKVVLESDLLNGEM